jgi:hypothetical protein
VTRLTKARLIYLAVLACLVIAFVQAALIVPSTMSDGSGG